MDATKQYRKEKDARKGYGSINQVLESKSIWLAAVIIAFVVTVNYLPSYLSQFH